MSWAADLVPGYHVTVQLEPAEKVPAWEYVVVNLTAAQDEIDLSTYRTLRMDGANAADVAHRRNLFELVGAVTVAGGHIEAEMKRIIIAAEEDRGATFVDVDLTWTGLEDRMRAIAQGDGVLAQRVAEALAWAKRHRIKTVRDDAVHSAWGLYDVGTVQRARFARKADAATHIGPFDEYVRQAERMWEYAGMLAQIADWPIAVFPPLDLPAADPIDLGGICGQAVVDRIDRDPT